MKKLTVDCDYCWKENDLDLNGAWFIGEEFYVNCSVCTHELKLPITAVVSALEERITSLEKAINEKASI